MVSLYPIEKVVKVPGYCSTWKRKNSGIAAKKAPSEKSNAKKNSGEGAHVENLYG